MKGVVYRDTHDRAWRSLLAAAAAGAGLRGVLGLQVVIDEAEGYAFLPPAPRRGPDDTPTRCPG